MIDHEPRLTGGDPPAEVYERALRSLLWRTRPAHLQPAVTERLRQAQRRSGDTNSCDAWAATYREARAQVIEQLARTSPRQIAGRTTLGQRTAGAGRWRTLLEMHVPSDAPRRGPDFHCDAALGGLARWLRAVGYDAAWWPGIDDDALLAKMIDSPAIMLTTDRRLMHRGVITRGVVPAYLVSNAVSKRRQLVDVVRDLELTRKQPRCMACGGALRPVDKLSVRDRIPPRTFPWRDEYFVCERCDKLFWQGTHWAQIADGLSAAGDAAATR